MRKFKKHNIYHSFILELVSHLTVEITHKIRTAFKTLDSKKASIWRLKLPQRNYKLLWKVRSSSYHTEQKTFIEASFTNDTYWRKRFLELLLLAVCGSLLFRQSEKTCVVLWSAWVFIAFLQVRTLSKYCMWVSNLVFYMYIFGLPW